MSYTKQWFLNSIGREVLYRCNQEIVATTKKEHHFGTIKISENNVNHLLTMTGHELFSFDSRRDEPTLEFLAHEFYLTRWTLSCVNQLQLDVCKSLIQMTLNKYETCIPPFLFGLVKSELERVILVMEKKVVIIPNPEKTDA